MNRTSWRALVPVTAALLLAIPGLTGCRESGSGDESRTPAVGSGETEGKVPSPGQTGGPPRLLAGTEWRLAEIQSMDDGIGTKQPEDAARYTLRLDANGDASLRLDCNRATGPWTAEPSGDPTNGRFEFGPLAATAAECGASSLAGELLDQLPYVRGYLLRDDNLYLSLMADGGILAWEPTGGIALRTEPDEELESAILRALPDYTREMVGVEGGVGPGRYVYGRVDLDGDGRDEVFVYLLGSIFCGTGGCNLLLLKSAEEGYSLVNDFPISRLPVIVSEERTAGWSDIFRRESGGGAPPSIVKHTFDGTRYVERDRLPAESVPKGTEVLTGDLSYEAAIPLEPAE
jgi:heat shock protein HslJ